MAINTSCVIHFTETIEALTGILKDNFKIHFCYEQYKYNNESENILVPMVSFCDIPLSKIKEHIEKYGKYGIGLTKEWAIRQGLNPIVYLSQNSQVANSYSGLDIILKNVNKNNSNIEVLKEAALKLIMLYAFTKQYSGILPRTNKKYTFYDENEWRYVYQFQNIDEFYPKFYPLILCANKEEKLISKHKIEANKLIENERLYFEPNDIKYIIVKDENDIMDIIKILEYDKGQKFSTIDIKRLTTRILTVEQIENDF